MKRREKTHQMINLVIVVVVNIDGGSLPVASIPINTLLLKNHYTLDSSIGFGSSHQMDRLNSWIASLNLRTTEPWI